MVPRTKTCAGCGKTVTGGCPVCDGRGHFGDPSFPLVDSRTAVVICLTSLAIVVGQALAHSK